MSDAYVERRDGMYMVAGTRVSLDSVVYGFLEGQSAEAIAQAFPVLRLEQVYGAITNYLARRDEVDGCLEAAAAHSSHRRPEKYQNRSSSTSPLIESWRGAIGTRAPAAGHCGAPRAAASR